MFVDSLFKCAVWRWNRTKFVFVVFVYLYLCIYICKFVFSQLPGGSLRLLPPLSQPPCQTPPSPPTPLPKGDEHEWTPHTRENIFFLALPTFPLRFSSQCSAGNQVQGPAAGVELHVQQWGGDQANKLSYILIVHTCAIDIYLTPN